MAKAIQRNRMFNKSDNLMLEQAQTMCNLFNSDKADFIALYVPLDDPFAANFQAAIDSAQDIPTNDDDNAALKSLTEDVLTEMENCRAQFMLMASYVRMLFPDSPAKQGLFGLDRYDKVRNSQTKMYDLMQTAYRMANSVAYKADLIALGFLQTEITKLDTYAEALYSVNELQEDFKKQIKLRAEQRIIAYNAVWEYMMKVSAASKQVYVSDYAQQQMYLLYPEGEGGKPGKIQNLSYNVLVFTASWLLNMASESYQLQYRLDDPSGIWSPAYDGTETSTVHNPGTGSWLYRVRGINSIGSGEWSNTLAITINPL